MWVNVEGRMIRIENGVEIRDRFQPLIELLHVGLSDQT